MTAHRVQLSARPRQQFVFSGRSVLVLDLEGCIPGSGTEGFFTRNTRFLSRERLTAGGRQLSPIASSPAGGHRALSYYSLPEAPGVPRERVYLEVHRLVGEGLTSVLRLTNYSGDQEASFDLALELDADFADHDEVEQGRRQQTAEVATHWDAARRELCLRYGHSDLSLAVAIALDSTDVEARCDGKTLVLPLTLPPKAEARIEVRVEPIIDGERLAAPRAGAAAPLDELRARLAGEVPRLTSPNPTVTRAWETATRDLASLPLGVEPGPAAPMAGLPLYQQIFGRDMLTIAWQGLMAMPSMMRDTLLLVADWQGTRLDDWLDEEPGKLLHQARWGPLSRLGINPFTRYYGDWATPQDFLIMLGQYLTWTGDLETVRAVLPAARRVIDWLDRYGDPDGDGFLEYDTRSSKGVKNQGWKDSWDAIVDDAGRIVDTPIATSETQGFWYAGLEQAAFAFALAGDVGYALDQLRKARALKRRFNEAFWMEDEGYYALALGPDKRQVRSISSNPGHLLAAGIVPTSRAERVCARLLQPDLFSGWGVRTLSSAHHSFNPFSYHLGSVWPVENGTFALGFARYGQWDALHRLTAGLFDCTELFGEYRLPEVVGGMQRDAEHPHPGIYPTSCEPQGWSASMIVMLVQALLGLYPVAPLHLLFVDPHLPTWLPSLRLEGVAVGDAIIDLEAWRTSSGATRLEAHRRRGRIAIVRQPPPQSPGVTAVQRLRAAGTSLLRR